MNSPSSGNSWIGRFVGDNQRYRLDNRLGGGGMGDVFVATDTRIGHEVALKLLKDTLVASVEMRKRFEREVAVCAALQSDHIVKISDCGFTPEGFPFYVMEYLRGQTLRHLMVREKQLPVARTVAIIAQVCKGLQLAHQGVTIHRDSGKSPDLIKVIHRDLKPDNIFLIPTNLGEWVKILDFGVAKIRNVSSEQTNITNITSTFIGTFRYSAPEQIQNDQNLDARADIYSLGIILYEMLSAADPFGLSIKSRNISEASWLLAHTHESPKALRSQLGCEHLSPQLEAVVMKCLQKKPHDRFATVEELNQALQAAVKPTGVPVGEGQQIIAQPQPLNSPGSNYETIPRPLNEVEQGNPHGANIQPQPLHPSGFNYETIPRPLNQVEQGNPPGSNYETIPRPLNEVEQGNPPGSHYETIPRPLNEVEQGPDGTMMQPRPSAPPSPQQRPDGTMMQPRPSAPPSPQQRPDGTMMQPRPSTPQQHPDGTMMQPRPSTPQQRPDGTMMQPRPPSPQQHPEGTMMQPRPSNPQSPQQRPDGTIHQSRQNGQQANRILIIFLLILGLIFGIGIGLAVFIHT
ncbi:MAG: protein kinase, partial [Stigonema ocellatum SAG 48.90 = DSM 106950]|nr:protein kinase [Stigonema ocellatum SAG 48.90 = DSM 106950]